VLLVCLSVALGAQLLSDGDEVSQVWAVAEPVAAGERLASSQLRPVGVDFAAAGDAARYVSAGEAVPESTVVSRDLAAGELLPLSALGQENDALLELPVAVAGGGVPATLSEGDRVDVWTVPLARASTRAARGEQVLSDVPVVRVGGRGLGGPDASRQVVLGVEPTTDLSSVVGGLADTHVVLVRRP
jgi:hypothetical protein